MIMFVSKRQVFLAILVLFMMMVVSSVSAGSNVVISSEGKGIILPVTPYKTTIKPLLYTTQVPRVSLPSQSSAVSPISQPSIPDSADIDPLNRTPEQQKLGTQLLNLVYTETITPACNASLGGVNGVISALINEWRYLKPGMTLADTTNAGTDDLVFVEIVIDPKTSTYPIELYLFKTEYISHDYGMTQIGAWVRVKDIIPLSYLKEVLSMNIPPPPEFGGSVVSNPQAKNLNDLGYSIPKSSKYLPLNKLSYKEPVPVPLDHDMAPACGECEIVIDPYAVPSNLTPVIPDRLWRDARTFF
jgi:hypothetical protein